MKYLSCYLFGALIFIIQSSFGQAVNQISEVEGNGNDVPSGVNSAGVQEMVGLPGQLVEISGSVGILPITDVIDFWHIPDGSTWDLAIIPTGTLGNLVFFSEVTLPGATDYTFELREYSDANRTNLTNSIPIPSGPVQTIINLDRNNYFSIVVQRAGGVPNFGFYSLGFFLVAGQSVGSGGLALPVEWLSFDASLAGQVITLSWSTASEINNLGFHIEVSQDAINWKDIGFVEGVGNTEEVQSYQYTDEFPSIGHNYYRIRQEDFNGDINYSDIREVVLDPGTFTDGITVFPNPVQDLLNITPVIGKLNIRDLSGRSLYTSTLNGTRTQVSMQGFPSGIYLVEIQPHNQSRKVFRVVH